MGKPTNAQLWLIHSVEFYVFGAVFGAVANIYGAFQTGKLDLASLGVTLGLTISGLIANVYKGVLQNANTMQAVSDTFGEMKASHNATAQQTGNALSQLTGLVTGLFHLHSAQSAPAQQTPVNPIPARPAVTFPAVTQFSVPMAAIGSQQPPAQP